MVQLQLEFVLISVASCTTSGYGRASPGGIGTEEASPAPHQPSQQESCAPAPKTGPSGIAAGGLVQIVIGPGRTAPAIPATTTEELVPSITMHLGELVLNLT